MRQRPKPRWGRPEFQAGPEEEQSMQPALARFAVPAALLVAEIVLLAMLAYVRAQQGSAAITLPR